MDQHLSDGSRVCIVGGGPAGSFAALHLLDQATRRGLRLEVSIFEPRDFTRPGPTGCNRCAGILSSRLLDGLRNLGITIPNELIQADVQSYAVHLSGETVRVERPGPQHRILSVYRGGGPRIQQGAPQASFDAFLLAQARTAGAKVIAERVKQVTWEERPVVHTAGGRFEADFLVLAIGVNSRSPLAEEFGYETPPTETMAQNEVLRPSAWPDNQVHVYFTQQPGVMFGALIPKGGYLNVSLLGTKLQMDTVQEFMQAHGLCAAGSGGAHEQAPAPNTAATGGLCGCTPRIAVQPARQMFGPRWVAVGDASVVRLYKDGIGSAFYTAQRAMTTAVEQGISEQAFAAAYAPFCRSMAADNRYGKLLFRMWGLILRTPELLHAWIYAIRHESSLAPERRIHQRILWGMFTGEESYRTLFWMAATPRAVSEVARGWRKLQ
jgi:flavin-dependent dehydrogenase